MDTAHFYEVSVSWKETRKGVLHSPELDNNLDVVTPPQFPGGIDRLWSPEHLFVASVNSCLMTTFLAIAENSRLSYASFDSKAIGKLDKVDGKFMMSEVTLMPVLVINNEEDREKAERILNKSEAACLISNSIKSAIVFKPEIKVAALAS